MTGYDADTETWLVEWLEGTTKEKSTQLKLPRLRVYLKAEDPFNFADRVADAHARRKVRLHAVKAIVWPFGLLSVIIMYILL